MNASQPLNHQPKAQAAYRRLLQIVAALEPDARLPSALELRAQLGVSMETLNLALRELERERRTYSVRGVGIFVAVPRRILMLCDPAIFHARQISPFWQMLLDELQCHARDKKEDYRFSFMHPAAFGGDAFPADVRAAFKSKSVQGVMAIGIQNPDLIAAIEAQGISVVGFGGDGTWHIEMATSQVARLGIEELAKRGCRRIGYWEAHEGTAPQCSEDDLEKRGTITQFLGLLRNAGLPSHELLQYAHNFFPIERDAFGPTYREQGYLLARRIFDTRKTPKPDVPDGLVIQDDMISWGVLEALDELGVAAGRDLQIATHANKNSPVLQARSDQIALIEFDVQKLAAALFHTLDLLMRGVPITHRTVVVEPQLRVAQPQSSRSKAK